MLVVFSMPSSEGTCLLPLFCEELGHQIPPNYMHIMEHTIHIHIIILLIKPSCEGMHRSIVFKWVADALSLSLSYYIWDDDAMAYTKSQTSSLWLKRHEAWSPHLVFQPVTCLLRRWGILCSSLFYPPPFNYIYNEHYLEDMLYVPPKEPWIDLETLLCTWKHTSLLQEHEICVSSEPNLSAFCSRWCDQFGNGQGDSWERRFGRHILWVLDYPKRGSCMLTHVDDLVMWHVLPSHHVLFARIIQMHTDILIRFDPSGAYTEAPIQQDYGTSTTFFSMFHSEIAAYFPTN